MRVRERLKETESERVKARGGDRERERGRVCVSGRVCETERGRERGSERDG